MYNQSFSSQELYKLVTQAEKRNSGLEKALFLASINAELGTSLSDGSYRFEVKQVGQLIFSQTSYLIIHDQAA